MLQGGLVGHDAEFIGLGGPDDSDGAGEVGVWQSAAMLAEGAG